MEWIRIKEHPEWIQRAATWFHVKWGIPESAYLESMRECQKTQEAVPQWYIMIEQDEIIAGLGVIENDFHDRKDLTPNVCAVYVEEAYRNQKIAGKMLTLVCEEMKAKGIFTLYLVTDYISFYERYGWEFLCMVQGEGDEEMTRMYIHRS